MMKKKYFYAAVIVLLFLAAGIRPVRAIEIPGDTSYYDVVDSTYILKKDVSETIQIMSDVITLDGGGYTISGIALGPGVDLSERSGVTIQNLKVTGCGTGIHLGSSNNCIITGNTVSNNGTNGISLCESSSNTITGNVITGAPTSTGIHLYQYSSGNTVSGNNVSNTGIGILVSTYSTGNTLTDNTASGNDDGISIYMYSDNNNLTNNNISYNYWGIYVYNSNNNELTNNSVLDNAGGIWLDWADINTLTGNNVTVSIANGIYLRYSSYNTLIGNTASNNADGIKLNNSSNSNTLTGNTVTGNSANGIYLTGQSNTNTLTDNTISNNDTGILLLASSNNQIYNNNFIDNATQAEVVDGTGNLFNLPAPTGGNYWSDWTGPDNDNDGFVDYPYVFTGGQDNYPLAPTPEQAIEKLIVDVEAMNLQQGIDNSLDAKLQNALDALNAANAGQRQDAFNKMEAFINAVEAQRGGKLTNEQADILIAEANYIISLL